MTPPTASQSSSVTKADDQSQLAMLLDIKKESDAVQMEFGEDAVGNSKCLSARELLIRCMPCA